MDLHEYAREVAADAHDEWFSDDLPGDLDDHIAVRVAEAVADLYGEASC